MYVHMVFVRSYLYKLSVWMICRHFLQLNLKILVNSADKYFSSVSCCSYDVILCLVHRVILLLQSHSSTLVFSFRKTTGACSHPRPYGRRVPAQLKTRRSRNYNNFQSTLFKIFVKDLLFFRSASILSRYFTFVKF